VVDAREGVADPDAGAVGARALAHRRDDEAAVAVAALEAGIADRLALAELDAAVAVPAGPAPRGPPGVRDLQRRERLLHVFGVVDAEAADRAHEVAGEQPGVRGRRTRIDAEDLGALSAVRREAHAEHRLQPRGAGFGDGGLDVVDGEHIGRQLRG